MTMARIDQTVNSLAIDDTVLFVNTSTNRIGINQGNPSVALHVVGSPTIDSGNLVLSTGDLTITAGTANIGGQTIIKATDPVSLLTNDLAYLSTVAVDGVTVTGDGTVGDPLVANIGGGNTLNDTYYRFETSTALTPGSGKVQFNNATFSSVTKIGFNRVNKNGVDIGVLLNTFIDASYQVYFQQKDDSSKAVLFNITSGATLVGDVDQFDVSHLQTTTQMGNGKDCFVLFAYREDSITGTIAAGQVAYGASADTIAGNNDLFWDATNARLGIGTQTPAYCLDINGGNANQIGVFRSADATARVNFVDNSTSSETHVGIGAVGNALTMWAGNQVAITAANSGNISFNNGKFATYNGAAPANGEILIGDASGGVWEAATLTAGSNITITNAAGAITIASSGGGGGVTSVATTAPITGGTITGTGTIGITQASGSADGYLSSANWTTFNNKLAAGDNVSALANDANYINPTQIGAFAGPVAPPVAAVFADSPTGGPLNPAGWLEIDVGLGPMFVPVYQ